MNYRRDWKLASIPVAEILKQPELLRSWWSAYTSSQRETYGGGRPAKMAKCPTCHKLLTAPGSASELARRTETLLAHAVKIQNNLCRPWIGLYRKGVLSGHEWRGLNK